MTMKLNEVFFNDLDLRKPDVFLNVDVSSLEASVGDIIRKSGELLRQEKPDALLVLGDTNSCLSAYMAKRTAYSNLPYGSRKQVF
ncbi:MAG: UDP-N-acetylglucosamine 2-epimerase [Mangrovibacterium sp.]